MIRDQRIPWGLIALVAGFGTILAAVTPVDYAWTAWLVAHRMDPAVTILRRTLFEGDWPGGSDIPIFFALIIVAGYLYATSQRASARWKAARPWLGYILVTMLAAGLGAVHTIKWILGRARPYEVLAGEHLLFTPWFKDGPHFVSAGIYRGSFPSGHTAAVFVMIAVAYCLAGDPLLSRKWRALGWILGAVILGFSAIMAVASSMARSHWISDAVGVVGLVWTLAHALYYWGLRVPEQRKYLRDHEALPLQTRWELRICGFGFFALLGVIALGLGLRALWMQPLPYLTILMLAGLGLTAYFVPRTAQPLRLLWSIVGSPLGRT